MNARKRLTFCSHVLCVVVSTQSTWGRDPIQRGTITKADTAMVSACTYIGGVSFAFTGAMTAGMEGMDLLGCVIVGFVTAQGGGSVRDVCLGRLPLWWFVEWSDVVTCIIVSTASFFLWPIVSTKWSLTPTGEFVFWTDTFGLAVFAASGASIGAGVENGVNGSAVKLHFLGCALCGMVSATFGGLLRDVLTGRPPRILYGTLELYAIPAFLGGIATSAVLFFVQENLVLEAITLGACVVINARICAANYELRLPTFPADKVYSKESRPRDMAAEVARGENFGPSRPASFHEPDASFARGIALVA